jgi:hypothetical protein
MTIRSSDGSATEQQRPAAGLPLADQPRGPAAGAPVERRTRRERGAIDVGERGGRQRRVLDVRLQRQLHVGAGGQRQVRPDHRVCDGRSDVPGAVQEGHPRLGAVQMSRLDGGEGLGIRDRGAGGHQCQLAGCTSPSLSIESGWRTSPSSSQGAVHSPGVRVWRPLHSVTNGQLP